MKRIIRRTQFFHEFEGDSRAVLRISDRAASVIPRTNCGAAPEHIRAHSAECVPVCDRETQMIFHRLSIDEFVRIVMPEGEGVFSLRSFELDFRNLRKSSLSHNVRY